jgi:pyruvate,water dikinase
MDVQAEVERAYQGLDGGAVAVRSSATAEDLPGTSFAGQYDSYLNVAGAGAVCEAIQRCWASLWSPRALAYRLKHGIAQRDGLSIAVIVQLLVDSEKSGILFTANPVNERRDQLMINASWGLGEAVVGGKVTPDQWVVSKKDGAVAHAAIADKELMTVRRLDAGGHGTETAAVPAALREVAALDEAEIAALVDLGRKVESHYGVPQDIEWAFAGGELYLLQTRPITSLFPLPQPEPAPEAGLRVYFNVNVVTQGITDPLTPMGVDHLRLNYMAWTAFATGRWPDRVPPWAKEAAGRVFLDITGLARNRRYWGAIARFIGGKDPIGARSLLQLLEGHADEIVKEGAKLRLPGGLIRRLPGLLWLAVRSRINTKDTVHRMAGIAERHYQRLKDRLGGLKTVEDRLEFIARGVYETAVAEISQLAALSVMRAGDKAEALIGEWLGDKTLVDPVYRALPDNPTTQMGVRLLQAACRLRDEGSEPTPGHPVVAAFLKDYGHRGVLEIDLGMPRWQEEPGYVVDLIKSYMEQGDPAEKLERLRLDAERAEQAIEEIAAQVEMKKGRAEARQIRRLLTIARNVLGLRERPKFDMTRSMALFRVVLKDVGRELVAGGRLSALEDVFFVTFDDIRSGGDLRQLVEQNKAQYRRNRERTSSPRAMASNGEAVYTVSDPSRKGVLAGIPVSHGIYEGPVRIVHDPKVARLGAGEILVTRSTDPAWTPLFLNAGALVMETGGPAAHGAIIAREYGIPAVAGVAGATTLLQTGQVVRVDGGAGEVMLVDAGRTAAGSS